jgi:hypothetical protein
MVLSSVRFFEGGKYIADLTFSSVSVVSDYRLDDRGSFLGKGTELSSSICVQTSSEAHPVSCTVGTGGPLPGVKRGRGVTLITHLESAEVKNE